MPRLNIKKAFTRAKVAMVTPIGNSFKLTLRNHKMDIFTINLNESNQIYTAINVFDGTGKESEYAKYNAFTDDDFTVYYETDPRDINQVLIRVITYKGIDFTDNKKVLDALGYEEGLFRSMIRVSK